MNQKENMNKRTSPSAEPRRNISKNMKIKQNRDIIRRELQWFDDKSQMKLKADVA